MLDDEAILVRTQLGQRAVFDDIQLGMTELRLLRLVNGYTALGALADRLDVRYDWHGVASELVEQGYIEESSDAARDLSTVSVDNVVDAAE